MAMHWYSLPYLFTLSATKESASYEAALRKNHKALIAHSVLACLAFAFLAPTGAIVIRLKFTHINILKLHGYWQLAVWTIYAVGFGFGIWLKNSIRSANLLHKWFDPHAYIGYILLGLLTLQPVLGYVHHLIFKRRVLAVQAVESNAKAPGRMPITYGHLWLGRIAIPAGIINGALGIKASWSPRNPLQSASISRIAMVVYCTLAGVVYLLYLAICIRHEYRRTMDVVSTEQGAPAAVEVANMPKSRRQSLETGKEILRIAEAAQNVDVGRRGDEIPLMAISEKTGGEVKKGKEVNEKSLPSKI